MICIDIFNISISLALGITALLLFWWMSTCNRMNIPPGPRFALPIVGHLFLMENDLRKKCRIWRKQYGDVFSLYIGSQLIVILNGFSIINDALVKNSEVFSDRPRMKLLDEIFEEHGTLTTSGHVWKEQRKASVEIFRKLGIGQGKLADKIQEEITYYICKIQSYNSAPVDLHALNAISISNNICSTLFGKRFEHSDPQFLKYLGILDDAFHSVGAGNPTIYFPALLKLPGDPFRAHAAVKGTKYLQDTFLMPQIQQHITDRKNGSMVHDFVDFYLEMIKKVQLDDKKSTINDKSLLKITLDLFNAGTETATAAIDWTLLHFLHYPEVQERCYEEIRSVVGIQRIPNLDDRSRLVYLEATIREVLRKSNIVPFCFPHATSRDIIFHGFFIPKKSVVLPNMETVLLDPKIWPEPKKFKPERFIGSNGNLIRPDEYIPFSTGRRVCMGESLARMMLFLYLSAIIQRFRFTSPEGEIPPSLDEGHFGSNISTLPYRLVARPRY